MLEVLRVREDREEFIKNYFFSHHGSMAVIKANYPGMDKRNPYTSYISYLFRSLLEDWRLVYQEYKAEGLIYYLQSDIEASYAKALAIKLEEEHPLGRLVDIDIYGKEGAERRDKLRKCFLCDNPAMLCIREGRHKREEIEEYFKESVQEFIFINPRRRIAEFAMIAELSRTISFGTVNFLTNGSHSDMNFEIFYNSIKKLTPLFEALPKRPNFRQSRTIGKDIEVYMDRIIGVNTHRGLIFHLLILFTAESEAKNGYEFRNNITLLGKKAMEDFKEGRAEYICDYKKYGLSGARGEAERGYEVVFNIAIPLYKEGATNDKIFTALAKVNDDTNILRRGGIDILNNFKRVVGEIKDEESLKKAERFSETYCISSGGTADLLAVMWAIVLIYKRNGWEL